MVSFLNLGGPSRSAYVGWRRGRWSDQPPNTLAGKFYMSNGSRRSLAFRAVGCSGRLRAVLIRACNECYDRLVKSTGQQAMREIQASEAKVHLPQLLDEVERGETLIITRHGRRIARIVPEVDLRQEEVDRALVAILEIRKRTKRISTDDLLAAREVGRKPK